ncbi:MAG: protease [Bdellovibrio sp. CG10_big_fil_rev_8_21_14_0_10_47_8]|nr:MAG: protease [Bdellovibrio sp. CG10_big_fil_rev_8_21_14_0_10_47_8]
MTRFFILSILISLVGFSHTVLADEFDDGAPEYDHRPLPDRTDADIQRQIQDEMKVACVKNLCQIVGADSQGHSWTVSFNVGYGQPTGGGGNPIYIGDNNNYNSDKAYAGITVTYRNYKCTSQLRVTPAIYQFVNTYMYNMVNHDYSTKRNFSPTEQTVILFYTTMLTKVESCRANTGSN